MCPYDFYSSSDVFTILSLIQTRKKWLIKNYTQFQGLNLSWITLLVIEVNAAKQVSEYTSWFYKSEILKIGRILDIKIRMFGMAPNRARTMHNKLSS